jgi:large subunit ribosomal protein L5
MSEEKAQKSPALKVDYTSRIRPALKEKYGYKNVMQVPGLEKIVINIGLGEAIATPNVMNKVVEDLSAIAGQHAVVTRSKKSIANFKLRAGMPIGCMVTLRGERMWNFLSRLINVALPRVRDFKGVSSKGFDGKGNYSMGLKEQVIFPEINYDNIDKIRGMQITVVTSASTNDEGYELLKQLGMPFRK